MRRSQQPDLGASSLTDVQAPSWYLAFIRLLCNFKRTRGSSVNTNARASSEQVSRRRPWNRLKISQTVKVEELKETDVVVAVMGPTGSGKSSFISCVAGKDVGIGHSLVSHTSSVNAVRVRVPDEDLEIVLVDTPGFDDTTKSDYQVLESINAWLKQAGRMKILLDGILYLHRISSNRMAGTPLKNLEIFERICGPRACSRVVMITTMWDKLPDEETGESRLAELQATFWKPMTDRGSKTERHANTPESAWYILAPFLWNQKQRLATLQSPQESGRQRPNGLVRLQYETIQQRKALPLTDAGQALYSKIASFLRTQKSLLQTLEKQIKDPRTKEEVADELRQQADRIRQQYDAVVQDPNGLRISPLQRFVKFFDMTATYGSY